MEKTREALSLKLNPTEIKNKEFKKTVLGYSPQEVVEFLDATAKAWERVQKNEKELVEQIEKLKAQVKSWEDRESELNKLREMALNDADTIRKEAIREAEKMFKQVEERAINIKAKTEEWLTKVIAEVEETEKQKASFLNAFRSALDSHYELLKVEEKTSEPLGAKLNQFLKTSLTGLSLQ
jgi:cell division initiation protein